MSNVEGTPTVGDENDLALKKQAHEDLSRVAALLKKAKISQNDLARGANYTPGYVSQILSAKDVKKLSSVAVAGLTTSARGLARSARSLTTAETQELTMLLDGLAARYGAHRPEIFGMDGARLDREAANYIESDAARKIADELDQHVAYKMFQVTGPPGQGKTWELGTLALNAALTHEVCWINFEGASPDIAPQKYVADELRRMHQRLFRALETEIRRRAGRFEPDAVFERLHATLEEVATAHPLVAQRVGELSDQFDRLVEPLLPHLRRVPELWTDETDDGVSPADRYVDTTRKYSQDDLVDDLVILTAILEATALLRAEESQLGQDPRRLLLLIDGPDRYHDPGRVMRNFRDLIQAQAGAADGRVLRRVLVAVAKTNPADSSAVTSSSMLSGTYALRPFTTQEASYLIRRLRVHGWFRAKAFADADADARMIEHMDALVGRNKRVSCLYLSHIEDHGEVITPDAYMGDGAEADTRAKVCVERWAQTVALFIQRARSAAEERNLAHVATELHNWCASEDDERDWPQDVLKLCERFGLIIDARVPTMQRAVAVRVCALVEEGLRNEVSA